MKYEDLFCTLEQAENLFKLGISQHAHFYFYEEIVNGKTRFPIKPLMIWGTASWNQRNDDLYSALQKVDKNAIYAAFTAQELGNMLPAGYLFRRDDPHWHCQESDDGFQGMCGLTMAQAMAFELISLIDEGRLTVNGINEELLKGSRHA